MLTFRLAAFVSRDLLSFLNCKFLTSLCFVASSALTLLILQFTEEEDDNPDILRSLSYQINRFIVIYAMYSTIPIFCKSFFCSLHFFIRREPESITYHEISLIKNERD